MQRTGTPAAPPRPKQETAQSGLQSADRLGKRAQLEPITQDLEAQTQCLAAASCWPWSRGPCAPGKRPVPVPSQAEAKETFSEGSRERVPREGRLWRRDLGQSRPSFAEFHPLSCTGPGKTRCWGRCMAGNPNFRHTQASDPGSGAWQVWQENFPPTQRDTEEPAAPSSWGKTWARGEGQYPDTSAEK